MTPALDVEECAACPVVNHCDAWNRAGTWAHKKGVRPCRPVVQYQPPVRPIITEEPIPSRRIPIIDADAIQNRDLRFTIMQYRNQEIAIQTRYSLRSER